MSKLLTDEKRITDFFACDVFDDKIGEKTKSIYDQE